MVIQKFHHFFLNSLEIGRVLEMTKFKATLFALSLVTVTVGFSWASPQRLSTGDLELGLNTPSNRETLKNDVNFSGYSEIGRGVNTVQALSTRLQDGKKVLRGAKEADLYASVVTGVVLVVGDEGIGAGALVTRSGHVITNMHVVGNSKQVRVAFFPKNSAQRPSKDDLIVAEVVKVNEEKDLALLKVSSLPNGLSAIPLSKNVVRVGDDVHAIGHPRGELWSYTKGYVSQLRRNYEWSSSKEGVTHKATIIQTQTPINPGNSGGPLINNAKELVGINSFKDPQSPGLNYAVDVSDVMAFLGQEGSVFAKKKVKAKKCGDDPVDVYKGENKLQGKFTAFRFDADCDGEVEAELRVAEDKSKPNVFVIDTNKDGRFDVLVVDHGQDGKWDVTYYDSDYDGKIDSYAENLDGNIVASGRIRPIDKAN